MAMQDLINASKEELVEILWSIDFHIKRIFKNSKNLHDARDLFFNYLNDLERHYFNVYSDKHFKNMHILEKNNAKECIRVLKNIIRTENEHLTGFSALKLLFKLFKSKEYAMSKVSKGFLCEFIFLFKGINGKLGVLSEQYEAFNSEGREAAIVRSEHLDKYSKSMNEHFKKYKTGYCPDVLKRRSELKKDILNYFEADEAEWYDYSWHLKHIVNDLETLSALVKLSKDEVKGLKYAKQYNIPFQITPYYLSLFDKNGRSEYDFAVRSQVLPSAHYCLSVIENRENGVDLDFMGEKSTSPISCITRRYPQILILKPFDSCPQICVYCQRNWEVKSLDEVKITKDRTKKAIEWIRDNDNITEVLITGGDPLTLDNDYIAWLINEVSKIRHVERVRLGTRTLVTLPFRIDDWLLKIFKKYHKWNKKEICIVTHFEHPLEVTPDSLNAIKKIKQLGINIYNQQVFTYFNSRRFETCLLRKMLKLSGVDPYYSFNTKGKEETVDFRVPIARLEQERKEEARLLPGVVRTDEPVFNVPKLGKSHLRAWQDHELIMVLANGRRVYRFYPWESKITATDDYLYTDVSIYDYLERLFRDRENVDDYSSIWYYF